MGDITLNLNAANAAGYTDSVDKLKQAGKQYVNDEGNIIVSYREGSGEETRIQGYAAQISALLAKGESLEEALQGNPLLQKKLATLLGCKPEELAKVLSDLDKSVRGQNLSGVLGALLVGFEDAETQKINDFLQGVFEPFTRSIKDSDLRELFKLLIMAFAQMISTQRESDLYNLSNLVNSFTTKIAEMKTAAEQQYDAAKTQAITSICMGGFTVLATCISTGIQLKSLANTASANKAGAEAAGKKAGDAAAKKAGNEFKKLYGAANDEKTIGKYSEYIQKAYNAACNEAKGAFQGINPQIQSGFIAGQAAGDIGRSLSQIGQGAGDSIAADSRLEKDRADREVEMQSCVLEIVRKAEQSNQDFLKTLTEMLQALISMMQNLNQNVRQTEMQLAA